MTRAQGQLMTRKVSARVTQFPHMGGRPRNSALTAGGRMARARAAQQTAGV